MKDFVIPFLYTLKTRIKDKDKRIAYLFTYIIPVLLYAIIFTYTSKGNYLTTIIGTIIGLIGVMSIYEIGYIRNDVYAVKKEKKPTIRLSEEESSFVQSNIKVISIIKYIISIVALICIFALGFKGLYYLIGLVLIEIIYYAHNFFRGKISIITFFILSTLRYTIPLIFLSSKVGTVITVFIFAISIPRTIEKASDKKFNIKFMQTILGSVDVSYIRVMYYIALVVNMLAQYSLIHIAMVYIIISVYYLIYRGAIVVYSLVAVKGKH